MSALPVTNPAAFEKHYSVDEIAELWGISPQSVRRLFRDEPGVLKLSMPVLQARKHKVHETLRVPASVLARLHQQRSSGFGMEVQPRRRGIK